jgi:cytochrome c-type biogenesis protein
MIDHGLAFLAGLLTVAAPCVLPMLPIVVGASLGHTGRWRPVCIALGFTLSFGFVALAFHAATSVAGVTPEGLRQASIVLLLVFGTLMVWPAPFQRAMVRFGGPLNAIAGIGQRAGPGHAGGLLLGMTLGAVWTPCAGPVLGAILSLAATGGDTARTVTLMACYGLGASLPMLAIAYGGQAFTARARQWARHGHVLQQGFGVVIVGVAVALQFEWDGVALVWLAGWYPGPNFGI